MTEEICDAAGELARLPASFFGVLSGLPVAGDDAHEIHSLRQVWQPAPADESEDESPEQRRSEELGEPSRPALLPRSDGHDAGVTWGATRITITPHDRTTRERVWRSTKRRS
jgi:hypothetical protein